ncbi:MAG TPA: MnmC family methyltransferase [Candidatus Nanoarchaeia archaeon]|nr:MnmC family methyltransferase [Candidatus Nanoarchaeia archaeon]
MKKILTADNSETFLNEQLKETYHSQTGAVEEALKKYAEPCKIAERARQGSIKILDICFGMGYNSAMAIEVALKENPHCEIEIVGLEYDPEIISKIQEVNPPIGFFSNFKQLTPKTLSFNYGTVKVQVILGDARETIKKLPPDYFDTVFFDPFSPKTSPEMWQVPFFKEIYRVMNKKAILSTYSCARMARENMARAGLVYDDGPAVGRRGPGTIAWKWV